MSSLPRIPLSPPSFARAPSASRACVAALLLLAGAAFSAAAAADPLRFLAVGDLPYSDAETSGLQMILRDGVRGGTPFILHVGDIKGGSQPCSERRLRGVATLFREQPVPVLYTPGDNEWTDCHRARAGGHDPLERLALLRRVFYADAGVLRAAAAGAVVPDPSFPENLYLVRDGVLLVLVHVVGSNNNYLPRDKAAMAELRAREQANSDLLSRVAAMAVKDGIGAVVVAFHANPAFEERGRREGFRSLKQDLRSLLAAYPGPVLAIHGDTHRFRFDAPLQDQNGDRAGERFRRLEVPGSPFVAGVRVTVDPASETVFDVEMVYPDAKTPFGAQ